MMRSFSTSGHLLKGEAAISFPLRGINAGSYDHA
jgi:hypothetical protein